MRHGCLSAAIVPAALACFGAGAALAACPSDEAIDAFVADWKAGAPTKAIAVDATMEDALCAQQKVVTRLGEDLGEPDRSSPGVAQGLTVSAMIRGEGWTQQLRQMVETDLRDPVAPLVPENPSGH
jgi:2-keto-4-pentenoate hydratase